ncbi:Hypothetical_protein [Hexamita inflata]|uniref:Hypothetical_protein n=1 Tax=Hexamita inflata TaxID=28002 RepID=A0AA86UJG1_9EUKA|nr:Hypothetical protein HINF_LOCUS41192 [Hexamita inflata]
MKPYYADMALTQLILWMQPYIPLDSDGQGRYGLLEEKSGTTLVKLKTIIVLYQKIRSDCIQIIYSVQSKSPINSINGFKQFTREELNGSPWLLVIFYEEKQSNY